MGLSKDIKRPLTEKQKECVEYYLSHRPYNQTRAYEAIYDPERKQKWNIQAASEFFNNPRVKLYKEKRLKEIFEAANINAQTIAVRLADIAFDEDEENLNACLRALDLLQKQLGLQNNKINLEADVNAAVQIVEDELED